MRRLQFAHVVGAALLASCSMTTDGDSRRPLKATVVLANTRPVAQRPAGPFLSILDSIDLRVYTTGGRLLAQSGQRLRAYDTSATLGIDLEAGRDSFVVRVLSNNQTVLFSGSAVANIETGEETVTVPITAVRPVLLITPDTARSIVTGSQYSIYNSGNGPLQWTVATIDTAITRCGTQCSVTPTSGTLAPGQTANLRVVVPADFPTRLFSFSVRSSEGTVGPRWSYTGPSILTVSVEPSPSLIAIGGTAALTPVVQAHGKPPLGVTWSSSNAQVASVDTAGLVTATTRGTAVVTATSVTDRTKYGTADVRVYDSVATLPNWSIIGPAIPAPVSREDAAPGIHNVVISAQAVGQGTNFPPPYAAVEFWARPFTGGAWRRIGQSVSPGVADINGNRTWTWSVTWNPTATDAPFANPSSTRMSILALGISAISAVATPVNSQVTITVP
jgi:hypothetical protein